MKIWNSWFTVGLLIAYGGGCASSRDVVDAGHNVGKVIRAPVDLVTTIGHEIAGERYQPGREFGQNWQLQETDPTFWEKDEEFFSSYSHE